MSIVSIFPFVDRSRYHPERRLIIFFREDGMYGVREEYFFQNADANGQLSKDGWASAPTVGIFDTGDEAVVGVKSRISKAEGNSTLSRPPK